MVPSHGVELLLLQVPRYVSWFSFAEGNAAIELCRRVSHDHVIYFQNSFVGESR